MLDVPWSTILFGSSVSTNNLFDFYPANDLCTLEALSAHSFKLAAIFVSKLWLDVNAISLEVLLYSMFIDVNIAEIVKNTT